MALKDRDLTEKIEDRNDFKVPAINRYGIFETRANAKRTPPQ
jgi:hypothetical protein